MVKCVGANTAYKGLSSSTAAFVSGQFRKQRETYLRLPSLWNRAVSLGRTRGATCRGKQRAARTLLELDIEPAVMLPRLPRMQCA